jgi:hypothetical protein
MGFGTCTSKSWKGLKIKHSQIPKNYRAKDTGLVLTTLDSNGRKYSQMDGSLSLYVMTFTYLDGTTLFESQ